MRRFLTAGLLGLLITACDGEDLWQPDTDIPRTDVYIANFSVELVLEVYVRSAGESAWGENWLEAPVAGGNLYAFLANLLSGTYDFRIVGERSSEEVLGMACVGDYIAIAFHGRPAARVASRGPGAAVDTCRTRGHEEDHADFQLTPRKGTLTGNPLGQRLPARTNSMQTKS